MQLQPLGAVPSGPGPTLHRTPLHTTALTAIAAHPSHDTAFAGTADGTLIRFSRSSGAVLEVHPAHRGPIEHLAWQGTSLVSGSSDGTAQVWAVGEAVARRRTHTDATHALRGVTLSDGALVTAGDGGEVRIYDAESGTLLYQVEGHRHAISALVADGPVAVTASIDHDVRVWDLAAGTSRPALDTPALDVIDLGGLLRVVGPIPTALHIVGGHRLVAVLGQDLVEWDLSQRTESRRMPLGWPILHLAGDDQHLALATPTEVRVIRIDTWDRVRFRGSAPAGDATSLALAGEQLLVGDQSGAVTVYDLTRWQVEERHRSHATQALVSPDGTVAATADHDHGVRLWSVNTGTPRAMLEAAPAPGAPPVAFSGDGQMIAVGRRSGGPAVTLYHHDGRPAGVLDHQVDGRPVAVSALHFAWDGVLVGPATTGPLQWWGLDGQKVRTLFGDVADVRRMALSGHQLIACAHLPVRGGPSVPHLQVWDLWRQCRVWNRSASFEGNAPVDFGPLVVLADGALLTGTGRSATEIGIYDLERGQIHRRRDLEYPWLQAAAADNGHIFVILAHGAGRELVQLDPTLDVVHRRPLAVQARPVALAADADRLAWAEGGAVVLTELASGTELARTELDESAITSLALSYDGERMVVGGRSGHVHILRLTE